MLQQVRCSPLSVSLTVSCETNATRKFQIHSPAALSGFSGGRMTIWAFDCDASPLLAWLCSSAVFGGNMRIIRGLAEKCDTNVGWPITSVAGSEVRVCTTFFLKKSALITPTFAQGKTFHRWGVGSSTYGSECFIGINMNGGVAAYRFVERRSMRRTNSRARSLMRSLWDRRRPLLGTVGPMLNK